MLKKDYLTKRTLKQLHAQGRAMMPVYEARSLLVHGNSKTKQAGRFGIMCVTRGLPIHDCPDATETCKKACYAMKYTLWNTGRGKMDMGELYSYLAHAKPDEMLRLLRRDIIARLAYARNLVIRIHDAGDFVNAEHAGVYRQLAEEFPMVTFYGYSRGFQNPAICPVLLEMNRLPNVMIRYSTDSSVPAPEGVLAPEAFFDEAKSLTRARLRDRFPQGYFLCPEQLKATMPDGTVKNGPSCADCGLCWRTRLPVVFKKH